MLLLLILPVPIPLQLFLKKLQLLKLHNIQLNGSYAAYSFNDKRMHAKSLLSMNFSQYLNLNLITKKTNKKKNPAGN